MLIDNGKVFNMKGEIIAYILPFLSSIGFAYIKPVNRKGFLLDLEDPRHWELLNRKLFS